MKKQKYFTGILLFFIIFTISNNCVLAEEIPQDMKVIAENDYLLLYIDEQTTEIAVEHKQNEQVWFSNPVNRDENEKIARGDAKNRLGSQFSFNYFAPGDRERSKDNYNESIDYQQFDIEPLSEGVRITYSLGQKWDDEDILPILISKERMESEIFSQLESEKDIEVIKDNYRLIHLEEVETDQERVDMGRELNQLLGDYTLISPGVEKEDKEDLMWELLDLIRENRENIKTTADVKKTDLNFLKDNPTYQLKSIPIFIKKQIIEVLKKTDYSPEMAQRDHSLNNIDPREPNLEIFQVPLEYILQNDELLVRVPVAEIEYPEIQEQVTMRVEGRSLHIDNLRMPPVRFNLMEFFGAAGENEEGYIFVPNGSGSLIYLNNGKTHVAPYGGDVYGRNHSKKPVTEKTISRQQNYVPIYGMKKDDKAFLAIIEQGASLARIRADVAGRNYSYNNVFASFEVNPVVGVDLPGAELGTTGASRVNVAQSRIYQEDIKVRYSFLKKEDASYMGMAEYYRKYLIDKFELKPLKSEEAPVYLDLIGSLPILQPVWGVSKKVMEPLTDFDQVLKIVNELQAHDYNNIKLRYRGWLPGGIEHYYSESLVPEKKLGTRVDFKNLIEKLREQDVEIFPEISLINIYKTHFWDGFSPRMDGARYLEKKLAKTYEYDLATYEGQENGYILSPRKYKSLSDKLFAEYEYYNNGNISFKNIGRQLNSDFRETKDKLIVRSRTVEITKEILQNFTENNGKIMTAGANQYIFPYIKHILDFPLSGSDYKIVDRNIPFLPIVLHGYINYTGKSVNLAEDYKYNLLQSIEMGASPLYTFVHENHEELKNSQYNYLYSLTYDILKEDALKLLNEITGFLNKIQGKKIINHEMLAEKVFKTTFENDISVIVNYNENGVNINENFIEGENYLILEE
ncbi:MAG: DUF5696 domain-containing protein [Halanaerobiaceae bacterium]